MKANTKYIASDGYENFMCPMTEFKVTQGEDVGTHKGTRAVDFASGTAGYRAPYYAPATVKCIAAYPSSGQGIWQTVNKVHCPNGYFGIVTFCTVHDDTFNAYVGMVVPQGSQLGNMGTKGYATGVHLHIEFIQSSYPGWVQNSYGVWTFNGTESFVDDTFYIDDTNVIYGGAGNWRKVTTQSSGYNDSQLIAEIGRATFRNDVKIAVRKNNPTGEVVGYKNKGDVQDYLWKWIGNGHRYIVWEEGSNKLFCAVSGTEERPAEGSDDQWATFSSVEDKEAVESPKQEIEKTYEDTLDEAEQIDLSPEVLEDYEGLNLTVSLVDKAHYKARCPYVMKPEYIVIHNAATPNGTAKSLCVGQNKTVNSEAELKSWHFSVDEGSVWESLPLNRNGFHASDGANGDGNRKGIAIEIARDLDGEEQYYEDAENRGALLAAVLLNKYGWDISHLKTHHDFAPDGKWCPHKILDNGWDKFVAKVQSYLDEIQGKNIEKEPEVPKEEVKQDEEQVDVKQVNSLVGLLIKLVEKLLSIFK